MIESEAEWKTRLKEESDIEAEAESEAKSWVVSRGESEKVSREYTENESVS